MKLRKNSLFIVLILITVLCYKIYNRRVDKDLSITLDLKNESILIPVLDSSEEITICDIEVKDKRNREIFVTNKNKGYNISLKDLKNQKNKSFYFSLFTDSAEYFVFISLKNQEGGIAQYSYTFKRDTMKASKITLNRIIE